MHSIRISWLAGFVASTFISGNTLAGEYFEPGLLQKLSDGTTITDTSLLSQGAQPPGTYRVHINVNGREASVTSIRFELNNEKQLIPCFTFQMYQKMGVDMSKVDTKAEDNEIKQHCAPIEEQVPGVTSLFDFSTLKLDITIPQAILRDENTHGVPVEEWDDGIPALITQYQLSGQQYVGHHSDTPDSVFANLSNGINIGRWRYRNNATFNNEDGWQNISNYVETAIRSLKAELTLGDSSTPSDIFDSLLVRGIQLSSDDDMLPDQLTGFAPIIRGIAKSNAQVTIRDNGYVIYQRSVPPGPFVISDLSSVSNGGKLEVTVTEADGSETRSTVSYSNVPQLLRTGQFKYSLAAGKFLSRDNAVMDKPEISQITLSYGLPLNITLYGGNQYREQFNAFTAGFGIDLQRLGGFAIDNTHSHARRGNSPNYTGDMVRLTWRNNIPESDTQIQLDSRYYQHDYLSFSDWANTEDLFQNSRKRREYNLTLNQGLVEGNSLYATLNRTENVNNGVSRSWQVGWSSGWKRLSFSLAWSMTRNEGNAEWDKQLAFTLTLPMSQWLPTSQPILNYTATSGMKGDMSHQIGINGNVGERRDLSWNSQVSYSSQHGESDTQSGAFGLDYQGTYGDINASYHIDRQQYLSWNASGSIVAHQDGITAGRFSNNSLALVAIPGASEVALEGGQNIATDWRGYAIVPDLQSYRRRSLSIDTRASKERDFVSTSVDLVPTKDAIVLAPFTAIQGRKAVMTVNYQGSVLPFGTLARIEGNDTTFYVGDMGQVYLNAAPERGNVIFSWGDNQSCKAPFALPAKGSTKMPIAMLTVTCQ